MAAMLALARPVAAGDLAAGRAPDADVAAAPGDVEEGPPEPASPRRPGHAATPRLELKRALSNRGATDESTRTTFRAELLLDGPVALLRLDLPYVDRSGGFAGDPASSGLGDLKARIRLAPLPLPGVPPSLFADVVFPTASGTLGAGKYQLGPGVSSSVRLPSPWGGGAPVLSFHPQVQHLQSVAGDPDRSDVSYTQAELKVEAQWPRAFLLSLNPKPVVDWVRGGETAAVIDLQGTWLASDHWRAWLKIGRRLWGEKLPTTYDDQLELGVRWTR